MAGRRHRSGSGAGRLGLVREGEQSGRVECPLAKQTGRGNSAGKGGGRRERARRVRGLVVACSPRRSKGRVRAAAGRVGGVAAWGSSSATMARR